MTAPDESDRLDPALRKLSAIVIIGIIAALLDTTIVNVAINTLAQDLSASVATIQWVNTGYLLAMGMVVPLSGWSIGRFGAKTMWLAALTVFLAGSIASGLARDVASLIVFRVVQGLGGGLMFPIMQTLLVTAAGGKQMGKLMATVGLSAVVVPILGPVVGGLIVSNLDWRWIFFVNIPLCLAGLVAAWRGLDSSAAARTAPALDGVGLVLLSPALVAILYGLSRISGSGGLTAEVVVPLVIGVVLLAAFGWHALRTAKEPIIDLRLFGVRSFSASAGLLFLSGLSLYGGMLLLPLYFQQARGNDPMMTGLLLIPQGVGSLVVRGQVGKLTDRLGPRPVTLVGIALTTIGTFGFTQAGTSTSFVLLGVHLFVFGAGLSAATVPVIAAAYRGLRQEQVPHASSATRILQQVGGSFGTAVLAVVLQQSTAGAAVPGEVTDGFSRTFTWSLLFTLVAVIPALLLPGRPPPAADQEERKADVPQAPSRE